MEQECRAPCYARSGSKWTEVRSFRQVRVADGVKAGGEAGLSTPGSAFGFRNKLPFSFSWLLRLV